MKHKKLFPMKSPNGNYTIECFFGQVYVYQVKVKNKVVFRVAPSENKYINSLAFTYKDSYTTKEDVNYSSIEQVVTALEKVCNTHFKNDIEFWYKD